MRKVTSPNSLQTSVFLVISSVLALGGAQLTFAGSATWNVNPTNGDWNTDTNWTPLTVPNAPTDTATFGPSNLTNISLSAPTEVAAMVFNPSAAAFTISLGMQPLTFSGAGVANNSALAQTFVVGPVTGSSSGYLTFQGSALAGNAFVQVLSANPSGGVPGLLRFLDSASADQSTITTLGSNAPGLGGGNIYFNDNTSAGNAVISAQGGTASGGGINFSDNATAGDATLTAEAAQATGIFGPMIIFTGASTMGHATITAKGGIVAGASGGFIGTGFGGRGGDATLLAEAPAVVGAGGGRIDMNTGGAAENCTFIIYGDSTVDGSGLLLFVSDATADNARLVLHGGYVGMQGVTYLDLTIGSLEGETGYVDLGGRNLFVGSNNLSTTYGGVLHLEGPGTCYKTGKGTLTLTGTNDIARGIVVQDGTLLINNRRGSGTGRGYMQVNAGTLGGSGTIMGSVTIGDGLTRGAILSPGPTASSFRPLTTLNSLTFKSDGTYRYGLNSSRGLADSVIANGVAIDSSAQFVVTDRKDSPLPSGTVLVAINNTAATAISGRFGNLPDGMILTVGSNSYLVSYTGGDGNDLTLTAQ